jgi:hypothetical protein
MKDGLLRIHRVTVLVLYTKLLEFLGRSLVPEALAWDIRPVTDSFRVLSFFKISPRRLAVSACRPKGASLLGSGLYAKLANLFAEASVVFFARNIYKIY